MTTPESTPARDLKLFWWTFAVRGGLALIFAAVLFLASIFLGIFFFDPVTLVYLSLLLGSFVLGNGLLLGVAAAFAWEHRLHLWLHMAIECGAAVLFGAYIGVTLMMTAKSLAFLAGLSGYVWFLRNQALHDRERRASRQQRVETQRRARVASDVAAERHMQPAPTFTGRTDHTVVRIDDDDIELHNMDTIDLTGLYRSEEHDDHEVAQLAQRRAG